MLTFVLMYPVVSAKAHIRVMCLELVGQLDGCSIISEHKNRILYMCTSSGFNFCPLCNRNSTKVSAGGDLDSLGHGRHCCVGGCSRKRTSLRAWPVGTLARMATLLPLRWAWLRHWRL